MASSSYTQDYSTLWSRPSIPSQIRPPSPPTRRSAHTHSSTDARQATYLSDLASVAQQKAVWHHNAGATYLPSRSGGYRQAKYRDSLREFESLRGVCWSGSQGTEEEEKELAEEEELRMGWRESLMTYGRSNLILLGKGKTTHEEQLDMDDRVALGMAGAGSMDVGQFTGTASMATTFPSSRGTTTNSRWGAGSSSSAPRSGQGAGHGPGGRSTTAGTTGQNGSGTDFDPNDGPSRATAAAGGARAAAGSAAEDDDAVFEGEYTLDMGNASVSRADGFDDSLDPGGIAAGRGGGAGGGGGGGGGAGRRGVRFGLGQEVDLDAGIEEHGLGGTLSDGIGYDTHLTIILTLIG